jgi:DNA-binding NarL/FixJ family response regulator
MSEPIRVVLVEDHVALRKGLELLLGRHGCVITGVAADAEEGYSVVSASRPDVAIVDIDLGVGSGVELTKRLLAEEPELGVLLYTGSGDGETLGAALDCGARGFAFKSGRPEDLREAIRTVASGGSYVDPALSASMLARSTTDRITVLSGREREVLDLLADGLNGEEVAQRLFLSPETIRTHIRNAMNKLEANTRVHAVAIALRQREIGV